jgi:uncharacterized tellurite resistance protein B-like protein
MYRFDAIYPQLKENDNAFASLIAICWLILTGKMIHPLETKLLYKLYDPFVKLRRDDIRFICNRIEDDAMTEKHLEWLMMFLGTSLTIERKTGFIRKMWAIAYSEEKLHRAEPTAIKQMAKLFGMTQAEAEQLHNEGKAMAGL